MSSRDSGFQSLHSNSLDSNSSLGTPPPAAQSPLQRQQSLPSDRPLKHPLSSQYSREPTLPEDESSSGSSEEGSRQSQRHHHRSRRQRLRDRENVPSRMQRSTSTPSPSTQELNEADIQQMKGKGIVLSRECKKLFNDLALALSGQWRSLGELMGIEPHKIDSFSNLYDDEEEATVEMLKYWVKHSHPTWHEFENCVNELPMVNNRGLLKRINTYVINTL